MLNEALTSSAPCCLFVENTIERENMFDSGGPSKNSMQNILKLKLDLYHLTCSLQFVFYLFVFPLQILLFFFFIGHFSCLFVSLDFQMFVLVT